MGGHLLGKSVAGSQQTVNHPRLSSHFGCEPAQLIGHLGQNDREGKYPHQPFGFEQFAAPPQKTGVERQYNQDHSYGYHDVVKLENGIDLAWPVLDWKVVQAFYGSLEILMY